MSNKNKSKPRLKNYLKNMKNPQDVTMALGEKRIQISKTVTANLKSKSTESPSVKQIADSFEKPKEEIDPEGHESKEESEMEESEDEQEINEPEQMDTSANPTKDVQPTNLDERKPEQNTS